MGVVEHGGREGECAKGDKSHVKDMVSVVLRDLLCGGGPRLEEAEKGEAGDLVPTGDRRVEGLQLPKENSH